jgi:hypothetical protein
MTNSKDSTKQEHESSSHPPYTPNSANSNLRLFGPLQDAPRGQCFADDELKRSCMWRVPTIQKEVLCNRHTASHTQVEMCVDNEEDFMVK